MTFFPTVFADFILFDATVLLCSLDHNFIDCLDSKVYCLTFSAVSFIKNVASLFSSDMILRFTKQFLSSSCICLTWWIWWIMIVGNWFKDFATLLIFTSFSLTSFWPESILLNNQGMTIPFCLVTRLKDEALVCVAWFLRHQFWNISICRYFNIFNWGQRNVINKVFLDFRGWSVVENSVFFMN